MEMIPRTTSVVTGKPGLEPLYCFKNFPVFFGCVETQPDSDLHADMSWAIDPQTGVIQLDKLIPLDILYQEQHVDGTGPTWEQYYQDFADYLSGQKLMHVLEIGGGKGRLAEIFTQKSADTSWTIVEPNPLHPGNKQIEVIASFFDKSFTYPGTVDGVVFSQVLEHAYDPHEFIASIATFLKPGEVLAFAYPNLKLWLERKYTNALNFEHSMFLTDYFVDYLLERYGFEVTDKTTYKDHSFFYTAKKKAAVPSVTDLPASKYDEYKQIFLGFVSYHEELVAALNAQIDSFAGDVYVFGAHIFSQYLFHFGLGGTKIVGLLDNSPLKQGKRLYGTTYLTESPEVLRGRGKVGVVLKVGIYRDEIARQLKEINPEVVFFE